MFMPRKFLNAVRQRDRNSEKIFCGFADVLRFSGFTFVELMLVIVLVAAMIALAAPRLRPAFAKLEVVNFSKRISALMRYAQSRAVAGGENIYLGYRADQAEGRNFSLEKDDPASPGDKRIRLEERYRLFVPDSIRVEISPPSGKEPPVLIFYPSSAIRGPEIVVYNEFQKAKIFAQEGGIGRVFIEYPEK